MTIVIRMEVSPAARMYFERLESALNAAIAVAKEARTRGLDPRTEVEVPVANDIADRVEALLGIPGVAESIRQRERQGLSREEVALAASDDFIQRKYGERSREEILEHAIRTAMALLTEGVVAAPTEGIAKVGIGKNDDGSEYLKIYYAGPIRSAGGTAQALSVLVGDYVRRAIGIDRYKPHPDEVERYIEEIRQYNSRQSLQYMPNDDEIRLIVNNCPVCIDGEATEDEEVSGYRNLPRVETNAIRGGMALVLAEGLALKAPKVQKYTRKLNMDGWDWLDRLAGAGKKGGDEGGGIKPRDKYLRDLIGGRPVFAHPMRRGGFRLRYGRSRNSGFAAAGLNPATMILLGRFLAVGTQMKVERPGKAAGIVPVDSIQGPTVRLKGGSVLRIDHAALAEELYDQVESILDVGEILISYGEFLENNHPLVPSAYCEEWWQQEGGAGHPADELEAIELALGGAYLHPDYTYLWDDVAPEAILRLSEFVSQRGAIRDGALVLPLDPEQKRVLEDLLVPHAVQGDTIVLREHLVLLACLGLTLQLTRRDTGEAPPGDGLALAMHLSGLRMRSRAGTRIGGRMGRPGKSKPREMSPPPHSLFPLGDAGGSRRSFQEASSKKIRTRKDAGFAEINGMIEIEVGERRCTACGKTTFKNRCDCGGHTLPVFRCTRCSQETSQPLCPRCSVPTVCAQKERGGSKVQINVKEEYAAALERLGMRDGDIALLKGVRGVISREKAVEPIEKGILRAKSELFVFKDGTIRYDMIDLPLTHFRPAEVGVTVERLRELGYERDCKGQELVDDRQVLELRTQDILISEKCAEYLVKVARFMDELLEKVYGLPPFYNVRTRDDLVGHLLVGLAPHTSAGVLARLVGFSRANVGYAHPFFHAAKRRNCFFGDTVVPVFDGKQWIDLPIRQLVLENFDVSRPELDRLGTYASPPHRLMYVRAVDSQGTMHLRRITSVSIHKAPRDLIRFRTARGNELVVTPDHTMLVWDVNYLRRAMAMEVKAGDSVPAFSGGGVISDRIVEREIVPTADLSVYCVTVDKDHTLVANGIFCGQCDGDEDCVMLLLDCLINFSRSYLPENRGGTMDAPLMIASRIDPSEIDKESHNVDVCARYPLELYTAALTYTHPRELEKEIDRVERRLGTPAAIEGFLFTHDTSDISAGPLESTYTTLTTMQEKLDAELALAEKIRAVDVDDVAERVLHTHFLRDLVGNLRAFTAQSVRCTKCNSKYRRVPLAGKCIRCGGNIIPTVHEASVKKYLEVSRRLCDTYNVSNYTKQRIDLLERAILSTFGIPREQQLGLADFL